MQSPRITRSTVLGKRSHQSSTEPATPSQCDLGQFPLTPDPTPDPKRARVSISHTDGDSNKENIPPFVGEVLGSSPSTRSPRSLRRTSTEAAVSPRSRNTPRRHASMSNLATPATAFTNLHIATPPPTPPSLLLPIYARARALLRPTCNSATDIAGRQTERDTIQTFITSLLDHDVLVDEPSALYISGSPGTGKTALVNAVLGALRARLAENETKVIFMNCMALNGVDAVWARLAEELDVERYGATSNRKGKKAKEGPHERLEKLLAKQQSKCIIVLDELDHISSNAQSLMSLFTLAHTHASCLRLIGIANTHTLTSSASTSSFQSLKGVKTVHFAPYTPQQLLGILTTRLSSLSEDCTVDGEERVKKFLPLPAVTLLTKKVAALTGDVRVAFETLRGAIDLAVAAATSPDVLDSPSPVVSPAHILTALKAYAPSGASRSTASTPASSSTAATTKRSVDTETVTKVRELGLHSRLVLLAMVLARKRFDAGLMLSTTSASSTPSRSPVKRTQSSRKATGMDTAQLHTFYTAILTRSDCSIFAPVSRSEFGDLLGVLETVGLVMLSSGCASPSTPSKNGKRGLGRSTSFNMAGKGGSQDVRFVDGIRAEEVSRGLGLQADSTGDVREEEVRAIWERERVRISRETKVSETSSDMAETFAGAIEA